MANTHISIYLYNNSQMNSISHELSIDTSFWVKLNGNKIFEIACQNRKCTIISNINISYMKGYKACDGLSNNQFITFIFKDSEYKCQSFISKSNSIKKLLISKDFESLKIGSGRKMNIAIKGKYCEKHHATLAYHHASIYLFAEGRKHGIFVNKAFCLKKKLSVGDCIDMGGSKIIIGFSFIAVLSYEIQEVKINNITLYEKLESHCTFTNKTKMIYQTALFKRKLSETHIRIDTPSIYNESRESPAIFTIGPALTMGFSSLSMAFFTIMNAKQNNADLISILPTISMSISMAAGSLLWPILMKRYERKSNIANKAQAEEAYRIYFQQQKTEIKKLISEEQQIWNETYENTNTALSYLYNQPSILYNRSKDDNNYLNMVLCIGKKLPLLEIETPSVTYEQAKKPVFKEISVFKDSIIIEQANIAISLSEYDVVGIYGEYELSKQYLLDKIIQLALLHNPVNVKFVIFMEAKEVYGSGLNKLPHVFSNDKTRRYIYTCEADMKQFIESINAKQHTHDGIQQYILFGFKTSYLHRQLWFKDTFSILNNGLFKYLHIAQSKDELSLYTNKVVSLLTQKLHLNNDSEYAYTYEQMSEEECHKHINTLNEIQFYSFNNKGLEDTITLMDLFKCGNVRQLNIRQHWDNSDVTKSLSVPIGYNLEQEIIYIDVHENAHGPHGLLAGMTGSGKSELLLTFVISLMINFSPNQVNFLFVDFKGGSGANLFNNSPHVAGILTNLQDDHLPRIFTSIRSEIEYRQLCFLKLQKNREIGSVDIDKYQQCMKEDKKLAPIAHLFIIIDEFAELKEQESTFMDQIKQIARIGRSLGIHLLLSTQKPAGVVDDQIWSNSRFHLCMKVQDKGDSMDMLKRDEAIYLKQQGEFILQVGNNEIFTSGKCAWAQSPYKPVDTYSAFIKRKMEIINLNGSCNDFAIIDQGQVESTQLEAIIKEVETVASISKLKARSIWLPPLNINNIDTLIKKNNYKKAIGLIDHPLSQSYAQLDNDILMHSSLWLGESFTMIEEIWGVYLNNLAKVFTQKEMLVYLIVDQSENFIKYQDYGIVQDIVLFSDIQKLDRLFYLAKEKIKELKIIIFFNDLPKFINEVQQYSDEIIVIQKNSEKTDIVIHAISKQSQELTYRFQALFKQLVIFKYSKDDEYTPFFNKSEVVVPSSCWGNGVIVYQEALNVQFMGLSKVSEDELLKTQSIIKPISNLSPLNLACKYKNDYIKKDSVCIGIGLNSHKPEHIKINNQFIIITSLRKINKEYVSIINHQFCSINYKIIKDITKLKNKSNQKYVFMIDEQSMISEKMYEQLDELNISICIVGRYLKIQSILLSDFYQERASSQHLCWIGQGFNSNAYAFKVSNLNKDDISDNQMIHLNRREHTFLQIMEEFESE